LSGSIFGRGSDGGGRSAKDCEPFVARRAHRAATRNGPTGIISMNSRHLVPREPYMPECHAEQAVSDFACVIQTPKPLSCGLRRFPHHKSGWVRVSRERTRSLCPGCRSIRGATAMRRSCCYPPDSSMNVFGQTVSASKTHNIFLAISRTHTCTHHPDRKMSLLIP